MRTLVQGLASRLGVTRWLGQPGTPHWHRPPGETTERDEVTKVYSVAGLLPPDTRLIRHRPFRAPHHSISHAGLVGGGHWPRPGEISLAHRGVLFLDELPRFSSRTLEGLRQPIEDGTISIARSTGTLSLPARFTLVAAMNPCPCDFWSDPLRECTCSPSSAIRYQERVPICRQSPFELEREVRL